VLHVKTTQPFLILSGVQCSVRRLQEGGPAASSWTGQTDCWEIWP